MAEEERTVGYDGPAGGWGSVRGMSSVALSARPVPGVLPTLQGLNKPGRTMCASCAWGKPATPLPFEFCENGAKATLWELTADRCTPELLGRYTTEELRGWSDHDLERLGRLTHPMRLDRSVDRWVPVGWEEAFATIGQELRALDPATVVFYASGRASLETSFLWQLLARAYGNNNLPDSANMCHETTSVALKEVIGSPVGTCVLEDFERCDAFFFFGQNPGANSPRFLHPLQRAVRRGARIIAFNPVREPGLIAFTDPQSPGEMLTGHQTALACQYHQVRPGGDIAALAGLAKHVLSADRAARAAGRAPVLDDAFIAEHTSGFERFVARIDAWSWEAIEAAAGLGRAALEAAGQVYVEAPRAIGVYGMGLTQHVHGFDNIAMLVNLLLMRGNIGRPGAGICPVRGHSNVQGQRSVGIAEKTALVPLERLGALFDFTPPRADGVNTVEACEGIIDGRIHAFLGLGGNFLRAVPEHGLMEEAWSRQRLTVQIATRLNRSHLINGAVAFLLPCLGRTEIDQQAGGPQAVSMEDSFSTIHGSIGQRSPASPHLLSEAAIVAGIAKATLPPSPRRPWDAWIADYGRIRDLIEEVWPERFAAFNRRLFQPGGFHKGNSARERVWHTAEGRARFSLPVAEEAQGFAAAPGRLRLITLRSNDQFNTTVYGYSDRLRGIEGTRAVLLINPAEMARAGLRAGQSVALVSDAGDNIARRVGGLKVTPFDLPDGCVAGYYPELNPLIPLSHHDRRSKTPAAKAVPVRIVTEPAA